MVSHLMFRFLQLCHPSASVAAVSSNRPQALKVPEFNLNISKQSSKLLSVTLRIKIYHPHIPKIHSNNRHLSAECTVPISLAHCKWQAISFKLYILLNNPLAWQFIMESNDTLVSRLHMHFILNL